MALPSATLLKTTPETAVYYGLIKGWVANKPLNKPLFLWWMVVFDGAKTMEFFKDSEGAIPAPPVRPKSSTSTPHLHFCNLFPSMNPLIMHNYCTFQWVIFFDKWPLLLRIPLLLGILLCPHLLSSVHLLLPELEWIGYLWKGVNQLQGWWWF